MQAGMPVHVPLSVLNAKLGSMPASILPPGAVTRDHRQVKRLHGGATLGELPAAEMVRTILEARRAHIATASETACARLRRPQLGHLRLLSHLRLLRHLRLLCRCRRDLIVQAALHARRLA